MGEKLEETLWGFRRQFLTPTPAFVIISDFEEEKQAAKKTTKVEEVKQPIEVE